LTPNAGTFTDIFSLIFISSTGIENPLSTESNFSIYNHNDLIIIAPVSDKWSGKTGSITVLDLSGRIAGSLSNVEFQNNTPVQLRAPKAKGMYVVEIRSGITRFVQKVIIK